MSLNFWTGVFVLCFLRCFVTLYMCVHMQGSVCVQSEETLLLKAPKDSHSMKSAERGVSQSVHKFTFTRVYAHIYTHMHNLWTE